MHNIQKLFFLGYFSLVLLFASCEKCWECSFETTISTPDSNFQNTVAETTCQETEKEKYEDLGYDCN